MVYRYHHANVTFDVVIWGRCSGIDCKLISILLFVLFLLVEPSFIATVIKVMKGLFVHDSST